MPAPSPLARAIAADQEDIRLRLDLLERREQIPSSTITTDDDDAASLVDVVTAAGDQAADTTALTTLLESTADAVRQAGDEADAAREAGIAAGEDGLAAAAVAGEAADEALSNAADAGAAALDAIAQAAVAVSNAQDAQAAAAAAQAAAAAIPNHYAAEPPTSDDQAYRDGALWFVRAAGSTSVSAAYQFAKPDPAQPGTWSQIELSDGVFGNIDAGSIGTGYLAAERIAASTITSDMIAAATILAANIAASAITTDKLAANAVTAAKVAADTLTSREIAADAITAAELAADAVLARNIKAGEIIAGKLAANSVIAANIQAATITGDKLVANTITAREILAGSITADLLSATAINGKTITGALLRTAASGGRIEVTQASVAGTTDFSKGAIQFFQDTTTNALVLRPGPTPGDGGLVLDSGSVAGGSFNYSRVAAFSAYTGRAADPYANSSQLGLLRAVDTHSLYLPDTAGPIGSVAVSKAVIRSITSPDTGRALLGDSDWFTPTLANATQDATTPFRYRLYNGFVVFDGLIALTSNSLGATICTLPAGFRPATNRQYWVLRNGSTPNAWMVSFRTNGAVILVGPSGGSGSLEMSNVTPYPADR